MSVCVSRTNFSVGSLMLCSSVTLNASTGSSFGLYQISEENFTPKKRKYPPQRSWYRREGPKPSILHSISEKYGT